MSPHEWKVEKPDPGTSELIVSHYPLTQLNDSIGNV